jgi:hypothetical protein
VWYLNAAPGIELDRVLTDKDGRRREYSVPQGFVAPDMADWLHGQARRTLPPVFLRLVEATASPFVQTIHDLAVPKMAFGRVCLTGDAAFVPRPHTAASTAKAAADAVTLAENLKAAEWWRLCGGGSRTNSPWASGCATTAGGSVIGRNSVDDEQHRNMKRLRKRNGSMGRGVRESAV